MTWSPAAKSGLCCLAVLLSGALHAEEASPTSDEIVGFLSHSEIQGSQKGSKWRQTFIPPKGDRWPAVRAKKE